MIVPLTRVWFMANRLKCLRQGEEVPSEREVFAEYDLVKRQLVWEEWTDGQRWRHRIVTRVFFTLVILIYAAFHIPRRRGP
jgi:hypothetical protein